jgi:hypothetical protein
MSEQKQNNAEIDLLYFFKPLGTVFKKIGNATLYIFRKIKANIILFGIIVLLITLAGFSLRYTINPSYQTEGIFVSNVLPGKYCSILLKNLNKLKGEKNLQLAQQLRINNEAAGDIQSISMSTMRDTFLIDKKDSTISLFKITLTLKSVQHLDTIQWGLVNYLENNEYAVKRKDARRKALEAMKANLNNKLEGLDSLKKIVNSSIIPRSEGKGIILGEPIDPVSIYQAEVGYYREQLNIDQALATIDNIEVIQPFLKLNHTNYPRYNWLMAWFFLTSLVIALLFVLAFGRKPK